MKRNIALVGSSGLLGSRLHAHLNCLDINVKLASLVSLLESDTPLEGLDSIVDVSGPNAQECKSNGEVKERFLLQTERLVSLCGEHGLNYYRVTSIHSLSGNRQAQKHSQGKREIYSRLHSELEELLCREGRDKFCTTIRLGNCFGYPIAPDFRPRHWLNIIGSMMLSAIERRSYRIERPDTLKGFIPLALFCRSFSDILLDTNRGGIQEVRSGYLLSLQESLELVEHVAQGSEKQQAIEDMLSVMMRRDEQVPLIDGHDRDTYKVTFIQELLMMKNYLLNR